MGKQKLKTLTSWFQAPQFPEDENKTRSAFLLNALLNTFIIAMPIIIAGVLFGGFSPRQTALAGGLIAAWFLTIGLKYFMSAGRITAAGMMLVSIIFLITTFSIYDIGTIRAPATSFYIVVVVMAGLIISRSAIFWAAGASVIAITILLYSEAHGLLPPANFAVTVTQGVTFTAAMGIISVLLSLAIGRTDETRKQALAELTSRQQSEDELRNALEREQQLNNVTRTISSQLELNIILSTVVQLTSKLVGADSGAMSLVSIDGLTISHHNLFNLPVGLNLESPIPKGNGLSWQVIETRQPVLLADYGDYSDNLPNWKATGLHSLIEVPLIAGDNCLGTLSVAKRDPDGHFKERDLSLVESIGRQTAIAIQNARLFEAQQHEIIERQHLEEQLRQSEEMYRSLFENVQVGVALTGKGKVLKYNETMLRQSGYTSAEIENLENIVEFYFDRSDQQLIFEMLASQGYVKEHPVRFKHKDGTPYDTLLWMTPTAINGEPYLQAVVQDITERKQAEQALRESEEKYRTLFDTANDAIILFDRASAKIINVNQTACRLYGYTRAELLQLNVRDISAEVQATTEAIQGGATRIPLRYHKKKDGTIFPAEITAAQFSLADSTVQVGFVRDITERIRAEKEREQYIEELGKQNAELERFTYTVSHDLRNPLVTIKGFLGALGKDMRDGRQDRIQSDFQRIAAAADKMHALLSELLALSRVGRIINPPEEIDLMILTQEAVENLDARLREKNVKVHIEPGLPKLYGDHLRLREVLENLVDNASKYMGGQPNAQIDIGARSQAGGQVIFVKDNGIGVESRYQDKIFGLFEKLDPAVEGTGIGLALVKRIIETHGGKIWVESDGLGKGSTFCFMIPDSRKENMGN
jgi:PAS domain S-box-containing protein